MATDIGIIKTLIGTATATTPSGVQRNLNVGDKVEQDELISTGVLGAIEVEFDDGSVMTLGRNSQATLSNELFGFDEPQQEQLLDAQPSSDVERIQQAILEGEDPTQTAEATAAGAGVEAGNEGSDFVQVVYENPQVIPEAGFDTTGISFAFDEEFIDDGPIDSSNSLLANQFIDDTPSAGTTILLLDEDDLSAGFIAAGYAAIDTAFETSTGFTASPASKTGNNDLSAGDDLPQNASTVLSGTLNVDFGDNGAGDITFNAAGTQPQGITSNGSELEYWVSDDGHTLVGFVATGGGSVEVVFTAEITNPQTGEFTAVLYGSVDHSNTGSTTEENLAIDLGFTVTDSDGDPAQGILRFDIDDEVPVIGNGDIAPESTVVDEEGLATAATQDDGYDGDVAGAAITANGDLNINWGADDGDARQVTFAAQSAPVGLSSNGEAVSYSISADGTVLTATAGSRTVFTVELSEDGRGTYDFTLLDNLDHPVANTEDDIDLSFSFLATDADGDNATGSFNVSVNDDAPVVANILTEGDAYNILLGARDGSADLGDWGVGANSLTGTLTMNGITANVQFVDNDSNSNSKLRIYNNNANHIGAGTLADNDGGGINRGEKFIIDFDHLMAQAEIGVDGLGNHFLPNASQQAHATWIAYNNGEEVARGEVDNPEGQNQGSEGLLEVFTIFVDGGFDRIELGNNSRNAGSNYEIRYIDASVANILDEEGLATAATQDYGYDGDVAGAALTANGDLNITWGADDGDARQVTFAAQTAPAGLTSNGEAVNYSISADGTVLTATAGSRTVFTVELSENDSGSYEFTLLDNLDHLVPNTEDDIDLSFSFLATDADGDNATGNFYISINDDAPVVGRGANTPANGIVDEEGLATAATQDDGYDGDVDGAALAANGDLSINWGADDGDARQVTFASQTAPAGLTSNGEAVSYSISADGTVLTATAGSRTVFTVELSEDGRGTYDFTLLDNLDHPVANTEDDIDLSFSFVATDADGDSASASFNVTVDDDAPLVADDDNSSDLVKEDVDLSATGNVLANDSLGADSGKVTSTGVVLGTYGQISFAENGDYTYQLTQNDSEAIQKLAEGETVTDEFEYTVTDGDGDQQTSTVTITITGTNDIPEVEALNAQTNEDTSIKFTVADLLVGASDIDETDTLSVENVTLAAGDGELVDNSDGTWTYVPAANSDVDAVINFDVTDGIALVPNTMSIDVVAVADKPNLTINISEGVAIKTIENLIVNGSFEDIAGEDRNSQLIADANIDSGGLVKMKSITGWLTTEGAPMEPHHKLHAHVGSTDGDNYMDLGASPGNSSITQTINLVSGAEYSLSVDYFDKAAKQEGGVSGQNSGVMQVIWNGIIVATIQGNNVADWETLDNITLIGDISGTNTLTFSEVGDADDHWGMAIDNVQLFHVPYQYQVSITTNLTDGDGSETLSAVSLSNLPDGVSYDGTNLISATPLTNEQINQITASVSSTETSNGDVATTTVNAKVEFDALDASAETSDLLIKGTSASESIIGGAGDDVIFGGAGDDVINGGDGADQFVWNDADVGTFGNPANDTLNDFDINEGDVLNLSDLLSDPSENNTITGLENNGHLEIQISNGGDVVQTIDITSIAVANDAAAVVQLNTMLANGSINDGI